MNGQLFQIKGKMTKNSIINLSSYFSKTMTVKKIGINSETNHSFELGFQSDSNPIVIRIGQTGMYELLLDYTQNSDSISIVGKNKKPLSYIKLLSDESECFSIDIYGVDNE